MQRETWAVLVTVGLVGACALDRRGLGEPLDATPRDSSLPMDSGRTDSSLRDAQPQDARPPDAAIADAEPPDSPTETGHRSCDAIRSMLPSAPSGVYEVDPDGPGGLEPFAVYCEMLDSGGWTLLLKMDGRDSTFTWTSPAWTNAELIAQDSLTMDEVQAKLRGFSSIPFTHVRLGMRSAGPARWIETELAADSLQALFSGGTVPTSAGRRAWQSLLPVSILQDYCNMEGVNIESNCCARVRLGILTNNEPNCDTPDAVLGFGMVPYSGCGSSFSSSVGNGAVCELGVSVDIPAFGWLLVR